MHKGQDSAEKVCATKDGINTDEMKDEQTILVIKLLIADMKFVLLDVGAI